jgi:hypothetical protein
VTGMSIHATNIGAVLVEVNPVPATSVCSLGAEVSTGIVASPIVAGLVRVSNKS